MKFTKIVVGMIVGLALLRPVVQESMTKTFEAQRTEIKNQQDLEIPQKLVAGLSYKLLTDKDKVFITKPLDEKAEQEIMERFLSRLDGNRILFSSSVVSNMLSKKGIIKKSLESKNTTSLEVVDVVFAKYVEEVEKTKGIVLELLQDPDVFQFNGKEIYTLRDEKSPFPKNDQEKRSLWYLQLKNDALRLTLEGEGQEEAKKNLLDRYEKMFREASRVTKDEAFSFFMNAYTGWIDPHTAYIAPAQMPEMVASWSLSMQGVGIVLNVEKEGVVIQEVLEGSPADQAGLTVGDRIVGVAQGKEGRLVDVRDSTLTEVGNLIRGPENTLVKVQVQKALQKTPAPHEFTMTRKKIRLKEQAAKEKMDFDEIKKVGVVYLPSFYSDTTSQEATAVSASKDVARIIEDLKKKGMKSLVIDLRNNGGGSLEEAVSLIGLFIPQSPGVQVKDGSGNVTVISTKTTKPVWEGALTVLVNHNSASASELFTAAIQDYGRGLVVGETTFGKGTVQYVYDYDSIALQNDFSVNPKMGSLKITMAQFYRVSGKTNQNVGVIPDVKFDFMSFDADITGESKLPNALPATPIKPVEGYQAPERPMGLVAMLQKAHNERAKHQEDLRFMRDLVVQYRTYRDQKTFLLNESVRRQEFDKEKELLESRKKSMEELNRGEKKDIFLEEAIRISQEIAQNS